MGREEGTAAGRGEAWCAGAGGNELGFGDAFAYILCECDHSGRITDGRLEIVGPFGLT
jgi:hypothetical protein